MRLSSRPPGFSSSAPPFDRCVLRCRQDAYRTGNDSPGMGSLWSMQEILPRNGPAGLASPAVLGELSRRLASRFAVHNLRPISTGLVLNSSGPPLRRRVVASGALRNTSITLPLFVTTTTALRSLASTQTLPARSRAMPSAPSSSGCATNRFSRHSVLAVKVVSQPTLLRRSPWRSRFTFHSAPRAVSETRRSPRLSNARPFATSGWEPRVFAALRLPGNTVMVPGESEEAALVGQVERAKALRRTVQFEHEPAFTRHVQPAGGRG